MQKKDIFYWALYDFANSFPVIVFALYFSQWLVIENHVSDFYYNLIFVIASVLLILTSPVLGAISDQKGIKLPFLKILTVSMIMTILITAFLTLFFKTSTTIITLAAFFFLLTNYLYQFSLVFYYALFPQLAKLEKRGFVSGLGGGAGWLGQIVGLLVTLPFATGAIYLFGNPGRPQTFLPSIILFFLFSLPMLFLFKEKVHSTQAKISIKQEYQKYFDNFKTLIKIPGMGRFLLGYFFFTDAVLTLQNNYPIYLQQVYQVNDKLKAIFSITALLASVIGSIIIGYLADKKGLKKTLVVLMGIWILVIPFFSLAPDFTIFWAFAILVGFLGGATYPILRSILSYLSPEEKLSSSFSYYALMERFSTFLGPLVWRIIVTFLTSIGSSRYRIGMFSMGLFVILSFIILRKIPFRVTH
ncbi:MFS transporter [Candidatus Daviesbacteria bacterium]|nr:MFS transporter [Candidatus Daviesbacteria bacterium]